MDEITLGKYWEEIPVGKENAVTRHELCSMWDMSDRRARKVLQELSSYDNGDDFILIRSGNSKGFYKTTDQGEIAAYRKECINKGRSHFAPLRKINRIAAVNAEQLSIENNLKAYRTFCGMTQPEVVEQLRAFDIGMDVSMLSRMESGRCLPTPFQLMILSRIYGCEPLELVNADLYQAC
jgi:hypothetical protein